MRISHLLRALLPLAVAACSSSKTEGSADAGGGGKPDGGGGGVVDADQLDFGPDDVRDPGLSDKTTGKRCKDSSECDRTGRGFASCSGQNKNPVDPTPACFMSSCDSGDGSKIRHCDGGLGVCLFVEDETGEHDQCLGACSFESSVAPVKGCVGKNACNLYGWEIDKARVAHGIGYCRYGCTADADCEKGKCQKELGACVIEPVKYAKAFGAACSKDEIKKGDAGTPIPPCACYMDTVSGRGMCSTFCKVGDTGACPEGYACDPGLPVREKEGGGVLFSAAAVGLAGHCLKKCAGDGDCTEYRFFCDDQTASGIAVCAPSNRALP